MEHLADEFIRRRRTITVGRGKRYPESMRALAVSFATEAQAAGWSGRRVAQRLGITLATMERWCMTQPVSASPGGMRQVVVRDESAASHEPQPVLVTPAGYRIEGLGLETLVEILQALGR